MPVKKNETAEDVVLRELPGFEVVKRAKSDSPQFLPPDSQTPNVTKLHGKYQSDSVEASVLAKASPPSSPLATKPVVVQPKDKGGDAGAKKLTYLVKQGKVRAIQG